jgi:hypothetical protein
LKEEKVDESLFLSLLVNVCVGKSKVFQRFFIDVRLQLSLEFLHPPKNRKDENFRGCSIRSPNFCFKSAQNEDIKKGVKSPEIDNIINIFIYVASGELEQRSNHVVCVTSYDLLPVPMRHQIRILPQLL